VRRLFTLFFPILLSACSYGTSPVTAPSGAPHSIDRAFEVARRDPNSLRAFLLEMPKGGDLHHHLTGAVYPEVLIQLASYEGLAVDLASSAFTQCQETPAGSNAGIPVAAPTADCKACADASSCKTPATQCTNGTKTLTGMFVPACCLCSDGSLYDGVVNALSMRGQPWGTLAAHDHFFAIFGKLGPAVSDAPSILAQLRQQASRENLLYIESMSSALKPPGDELKAFQALFSGGDSSLGAAFCQRLMAGPLDTAPIGEDGKAVLAAADALGRQTAAAMAGQLEASSKLLGCDAHPDAPGCEVTVRRQIEMHRSLAPAIICQEALLGFAASHADRQHVVGINIVAAEDAYIARADYLAHMNLIGNLGRIYPDVGRALHAGELAEGLVPPNDLRFHIVAAVCTAGAQRIGHGVDITYEADSGPVLREMAGRKPAFSCPAHPTAGPVAVEINLVSNAQLLGVQGREHPLPLYLGQGVPVVLSTDDPGIMRTSLTEQYRLAGLVFPQLRYADLRTFNRNSLEYSFLTGASIWEDSGVYRRPVAACRTAAGGLDLDRCAGWAQSQREKARLQLELERRLRSFESRHE
jgi:adenosine deaminase